MSFDYVLEDIGEALDTLIQQFLDMWNNIVALLNPEEVDDGTGDSTVA